MPLHFEEPASHPAPPAATVSSTEEPSSGSPSSTSCLNCSSHPIEYQSPGCKHPTLCKKCAMKQATGGKCKVCGDKFFELQRI